MKSYKSNWKKLQENGHSQINAIVPSSGQECDPESPTSSIATLYEGYEKQKSSQLENLIQSRSIDGAAQSPSKITIKSLKTFNSTMKLDLMSLFSKDVISERKRNDPRETDAEFEVIQENESEIESDSDLKVDEDISEIRKVRFYHTDDKIYAPINSEEITIYNKKPNNKRNLNSDRNKVEAKTIEHVLYKDFCKLEIQASQVSESFDSTEEKKSDKANNAVNIVRKSLVHQNTPKFKEAKNPRLKFCKRNKLNEINKNYAKVKTFNLNLSTPKELNIMKAESFNPFEIAEEIEENGDYKPLGLPIRESFKLRRKSDIGNENKYTHLPTYNSKKFETNEVMKYEYRDPNNKINSISTSIDFHNAEKYFNYELKQTNSSINQIYDDVDSSKDLPSQAERNDKKIKQYKLSKYLTMSKQAHKMPSLKTQKQAIENREKSKSGNFNSETLNESYYSK